MSLDLFVMPVSVRTIISEVMCNKTKKLSIIFHLKGLSLGFHEKKGL